MDRQQRNSATLSVLAFFALAYCISWSTWLVSPALSRGDMDLQRMIDIGGAFGPSLAALILNARRNRSGHIPTALLCPAAFAVSFAGILPLGLLALRPVFAAVPSAGVIAAVGVNAALAAVLVSSAVAARRRHPTAWPATLVSWRHGIGWYAIALLLFPGAIILGGLVDRALAGQALLVPAAELLGGVRTWSFIALVFVFYGGALNEEPGWRGYAMPRLLARYTPLVSTVILGAVWALWHAPLHYNGFYAGGAAALAGRLLYTIPLTGYFTWLYLRTGGNILMAVLLHASVNSSLGAAALTARAALFANVILVAVLLLMLADPVWRRRPTTAGLR